MDTDRTMLTAGHVMQRNVFTVSSGTQVLDAVEKLLERGFSGAPVVDGDHIVGIFSERDGLTAIASAHYEGEPPGTVAQHMRREYCVVSRSTDLYKVASAFRDNPIRRMPVIANDGSLCGIISRGDVLKALRQLYTHREKSNYQRLQDHMNMLQ
ncbi:MAG: CBS domain-containing protein [Planctomycetes bacterium]|nr:CBS domain-containing protein [Planctomycetota bacterium]